jgi:enoyl-CoA hydratase/carnithine racemase
MEYTFIDVHTDGFVGRIVLDRPDHLNALVEGMLVELERAFDDVAGMQSVHVIVLEAAGKAFSVGHDLRDMVGEEEHYFQRLFAMSASLMGTMRSTPQPIIAKVHGVAAAAGCQLVAACDLVVASEEARFGTTGLKVGLFCSTPMVPLARAIGRKRALEMLLTGDLIDARTAGDWGLVNRVVPPSKLEEATMELAAQIAEYAPTVVGLGKQAFYRGFSAFLEKRPADWMERST